MLILGIESSTMVGSVALLSGERLIGEYTLSLKRTHSERLMVAVEHLLEIAETDIAAIDGIAVSIGPGSYTGIRIGVTTAKSLAWALGKPLVGVQSLLALAYSGTAYKDVILAPSIAAKGSLLFAAAYRYEPSAEPSPLTVLEPRGIDAAEFAGILSRMELPVLPLGDGYYSHENVYELLKLSGRLLRVPESQGIPRASLVAEAARVRLERGEMSDPRQLVPFYLRAPEAEVNWARKHGSSPFGSDGG